MADFVLRGGILVHPDRPPERGDVLVRQGRIAGLLAPNEPVARDVPVADASGKHVFAGLIDAHIHFGFAEKVQEYATETAFAAQGGIATVLGYFLNNEAYTDVYKREQDHARPRAHVDYGFHFSTANELHIRELASYVRDYGVTSFKYFMNFKGEEGRYLGLDGTDDGYFYDLLAEAARIGRIVVVCHTENIELVNRFRRRMQGEGRDTLKDWCQSKPPITEAENCIRAMYFAERLGARIYFPHISSALALEEIRKWRPRYGEVYIETCPQYLTHTEDSDLGSIGKANPPFRKAEDIDALWRGLADGTINVFASDHVPRKRATKEKGIWLASQGFPGSAFLVPVLLSEGYHKGRLSLQRIAQVLGANPAHIFGLAPKKGAIAVGADADFTIVDLDRERVVRAADFASYSDYTIYEGWTFKGWPVCTIVRGVTVMKDGAVVGPPGHGAYIERPVAKETSS